MQERELLDGNLNNVRGHESQLLYNTSRMQLSHRDAVWEYRVMPHSSTEMIDFIIASMPDDAPAHDVQVFRSILERLVQVARDETVARIELDMEAVNAIVDRNSGRPRH